MLQRITYLHQDGCFQAQRAPAGGVSECPPISSWVALYCDITRVLQWLLSAHGPSGKASSGCPIILFHLKGDSTDDTVKIRQGHIKKLSQVLYCTAQHRTAHLTNIFWICISDCFLRAHNYFPCPESAPTSVDPISESEWPGKLCNIAIATKSS